MFHLGASLIQKVAVPMFMESLFTIPQIQYNFHLKTELNSVDISELPVIMPLKRNDVYKTLIENIEIHLAI